MPVQKFSSVLSQHLSEAIFHDETRFQESAFSGAAFQDPCGQSAKTMQYMCFFAKKRRLDGALVSCDTMCRVRVALLELFSLIIIIIIILLKLTKLYNKGPLCVSLLRYNILVGNSNICCLGSLFTINLFSSLGVRLWVVWVEPR